jgi:hypothetical protein
VSKNELKERKKKFKLARKRDQEKIRVTKSKKDEEREKKILKDKLKTRRSSLE